MLEIEKIANNIKITEVKESEFNAEYIIEPLYRGYGNTVGNAMRRVLLSSIPGAAIKAVKIDGVLDEFSTIEGVKESVTDIILNLKEIVVKSESVGEKKMSLSVTGPKVITAADIKLDSDIVIINPEQVILNLTTDRKIEMEILIDSGESFVVAEELDKSNWDIGFMAVDAIYTPIRKVSYTVEDTMVGRITNFDKLILKIQTDGSINVKDAISYASDLLIKHFNPFLEIGNKMERYREEDEIIDEESEEENAKEKDMLSMKIEELDLTVRSFNCLKKAEISTVGELAALNYQDLLKIKNLGKKSLSEIEDKMKELGIDFSENSNDE